MAFALFFTEGMYGIFRFGLLPVFIALQVGLFGTALLIPPTTTRGLSFDTITKLARKRYQNNDDVRNGNESPPMEGRIAVITGAAGGIGGELAKVVYRLGGTVVALDRNTTGLEVLRKTLIEEYSYSSNGTGDDGDVANDEQNHSDDEGDRILILPTNHEDLASVASSAEIIKSRFSQIDLLVNNAGMTYSKGPMASAHGKDLAFTVNYLSHFLLTEKILQRLSNNGRIVHITSTYHWKIDGSELLPDKGTGIPIAYQSDPKLQSSKHVERSYANTKLAQIWHSRSIAQALPKGARCSSVCACPSWAATGIAGDENKNFLKKYAFPISDFGPGITSAINGMLRTDDELGDALNDGKSFVANSSILNSLKVKYLLASKLVTKTLGWRDKLTDLLGVLLLFFQKFKYGDFIIQETSPESLDKEKRDQFYRWSKEEVNQWL